MRVQEHWQQMVMFSILQRGCLVLLVPVDTATASLMEDVYKAEAALKDYAASLLMDGASQVRYPTTCYCVVLQHAHRCPGLIL